MDVFNLLRESFDEQRRLESAARDGRIVDCYIDGRLVYGEIL